MQRTIAWTTPRRQLSGITPRTIVWNHADGNCLELCGEQLSGTHPRDNCLESRQRQLPGITRTAIVWNYAEDNCLEHTQKTFVLNVTNGNCLESRGRQLSGIMPRTIVWNTQTAIVWTHAKEQLSGITPRTIVWNHADDNCLEFCRDTQRTIVWNHNCLESRGRQLSVILRRTGTHPEDNSLEPRRNHVDDNCLELCGRQLSGTRPEGNCLESR
jgi:hypothetical protein